MDLVKDITVDITVDLVKGRIVDLMKNSYSATMVLVLDLVKGVCPMDQWRDAPLSYEPA